MGEVRGAMTSLETDVEQRGEICLVKLTGDLTSYSSPAFSKLWHEEVSAGHVKVALDFSEVGLISSAGIGEIVALTREVQAQNGGLSLCTLNEICTDAFELTGLLPILDIFPTVDAGIAALLKE